MAAQYAIGIDLGTTNSSLAYAALDERAEVRVLPIPQLVAASTVETRSMLPSFLYLAADQEKRSESFNLPWAKKRDYAAGEWARKQAADVPTRTVTAAKSWLCHSRIDRRQALLPFEAPAEVGKISPVEASRRYLQHLVDAWKSAFPKAPLADQHVVLTVPASFDAAARELTREAALAAGVPESVVLLEEPQAALYAWLADLGEKWRRKLKVGDTLLVCDVGGGTTDFTLIRVTEESGELALSRIAVGNHILAGGDNMDLALAHHMAAGFRQKGIELDPWQSVSLWHSCRTAKETLLSDEAHKKHSVTVLGRGSRMVGGTISIDLERKAAATLLGEGFFPICELADKPARQALSGFRQLGLPFEADTAITRHLADFLTAHGDESSGALRPTHVLFNGGVFRASLFRERVFEALRHWFGEESPPVGLEGNQDLDLAVARGAAYYGLAKQGRGVRIRGGTARSYYVGIETAGLAIPGAVRPVRALCVVPIGMEEGTEADVPGPEIGLVVGEPAMFRFFSSAIRKQDQPGNLISAWSEEEISETDSMEATLPPADDLPDQYVPVRFHSQITELGVLELWCVQAGGDRRWKLEFSVRQDAERV